MFNIKDLKWSPSALEPYMSNETINFHYGKHYKGYINKTNELIAESNFQVKSLIEIIKTTDNKPLFNNAAQAWNHEFFWESLCPVDSQKPGGMILDMINKQYNDFAFFKKEFADKSISHFGSGWTWLVLNNEKLEIYPTSNAKNPLNNNHIPLLTLDLWEHAYYIDYRNERAKYVNAFLDHLANWNFVNYNLSFTTVG